MLWCSQSDLIVLAALLTLGACALDKQGAPNLSGPSEFALSLAVSATPDIITQDGVSQATIQVVARDANAQPLRGVEMRLQVYAGGSPTDFGNLTSKSIMTGSDGRASAIYTAPPAPPPTVSDDTTISVQILPVNGDFANATARYVDIRLVRPGVITPPGDAPTATFSFSPTKPHENEDAFFDASASEASSGHSITSYLWSFGDGRTDSGAQVRHSYDAAGDYVVTLTVKDDLGRASSKALPLTVQAGSVPVANFTISPTGPHIGDQVHFNGSLSTVGAGRVITRYEWDFGDGFTAEGVTPTHVYGAEGTYTVVLKVTDSTGVTGTTSKPVTVTITP